MDSRTGVSSSNKKPDHTHNKTHTIFQIDTLFACNRIIGYTTIEGILLNFIFQYNIVPTSASKLVNKLKLTQPVHILFFNFFNQPVN